MVVAVLKAALADNTTTRASLRRMSGTEEVFLKSLRTTRDIVPNKKRSKCTNKSGVMES